MRIATWNVNGVQARLQYILRWLAERKPDLVGLQIDGLLPSESAPVLVDLDD